MIEIDFVHVFTSTPDVSHNYCDILDSHKAGDHVEY